MLRPVIRDVLFSTVLQPENSRPYLHPPVNVSIVLRRYYATSNSRLKANMYATCSEEPPGATHLSHLRVAIPEHHKFRSSKPNGRLRLRGTLVSILSRAAALKKHSGDFPSRKRLLFAALRCLLTGLTGSIPLIVYCPLLDGLCLPQVDQIKGISWRVMASSPK